MFDVVVKYVSNCTKTFLESFDEDWTLIYDFFVVNFSLEFATEVETSYGFILKLSFYVAVHQIPYKVAPPTGQ